MQWLILDSDFFAENGNKPFHYLVSKWQVVLKFQLIYKSAGRNETHIINGKIETANPTTDQISRYVPLTSVQGPALFILFTEDFPSYSKTLQYDDNTVQLLGKQMAE